MKVNITVDAVDLMEDVDDGLLLDELSARGYPVWFNEFPNRTEIFMLIDLLEDSQPGTDEYFLREKLLVMREDFERNATVSG